MSTSLVLGVVGGIVGGIYGGPQGAALGYSIGSGIGSAVDVSKQRITNEGPRLGELKVQASQYGGAISRLYGTHRIAGNVIASTNIIEHENRTSSRAGKGGPKVTNIEYTYTVDMAVALCEGEITGIRRIWANGKVVYDASESATGGAVIASAQLAESITVYTGTETQLPDPTLEAYLGVGNVPAYRGLAYVVFNDMQVTEFGGRVPQLEFEVVKAGDPVPRLIFGDAGATGDGGIYGQQVSIANVSTNGDDTLVFRARGVDNGGVYANKRIDIFSASMDGLALLSSFQPIDQVYNYYFIGGYSDVPGIFHRHVTASTYLDTGYNVFIDQSGVAVRFFTDTLLAYGQSSSRWSKRGDRLVVTGDENQAAGMGSSACLFNFSTTELIARIDLAMPQPIGNVLLTDNYVWLMWEDISTSHTHVQVRSADDFSLAFDYELPSSYDNINLTNRFGVNDDDTLSLWTNLTSGTPNYSELVKLSPSGAMEIIASETDASFDPTAVEGLSDVGIFVRGSTVFGARVTLPASDPTIDLYVATFNSLEAQGVPLSEIIEAETALCDIDSADIDVSDCTEEVMGYAIARVATTRANLEPLLVANRRDAIESEWQLKFPKRGSAPVLTIPYNDLGAEESEVSMAEPLATTRAQELDLPRTLLVNYINAEQDYLGGTEPSRRLITRASKELAVDVAVVMTPDQAAQVADAIMYDTWTARTARSISVLRKYSALESGDVFNVIDRAGNTLRLRAVETEYAGPVIKINTVEDDATVNTQTSVGATPGQPQSVVAIAPRTVADFLDIPILRDEDDDPGIYVAMRPVRPTGWTGAELLMDSSGDLSLVGVVRNSATVGAADTVLGDWAGGNVFDETNTLTVTLYSGELESATRDDLIEGTVNALLVGDEIIQFYNCTLVSGATYTVSGLLRGRRGTEQFQRSHAAGERVVLLGLAGMLRATMGVSELNTDRLFDTRSFGRGNLVPYTVNNTGVGLKPFAVVDIRRDGDAFEWNRRSRLQHRFLAPDIDPPLGEQVEAYDAVLADSGGAILESATVSIPRWEPATALSAGQVITVYQRSASVGRGYPTSLTV